MDAKSLIRQDILRKRDSLDSGARRSKDLRIRETLLSLPEFDQADVVLFFASFRSEVSTFPIMEEALRLGKSVLLPRVNAHKRELRLFEIRGIDELSPGYMRIPEPAVSGKRERDVNDASLVVLPGAAFDPEGDRLGYGGGYYDRLLARLTRKIPLVALAYEEQIVDSLPFDVHDIKVDVIVTDGRVIRCRAEDGR